MRQVPDYLLVGRGRLAKHLAHYFTLKQIPFLQWSRSDLDAFAKVVQQSEVVLLAISDDALEPFIKLHQDLLADKRIVHFSGALYLPQAIGCHPLMTFAEQLYDLSVYEQMFFILDTEQSNFAKLFPQLANPCKTISPEDKHFYHALCVLIGNAPVVLWQQACAELKNKMNLSDEAFQPYLQQMLSNYQAAPQKALTGPWMRADHGTIKKNLEALKDNTLHQAYQTLYNLHRGQYEVDCTDSKKETA